MKSFRHILYPVSSIDHWGVLGSPKLSGRAVDTLYRRFSMTARAMAQKFGRDKLSHSA
jgi:hypothetical protein